MNCFYANFERFLNSICCFFLLEDLVKTKDQPIEMNTACHSSKSPVIYTSILKKNIFAQRELQKILSNIFKLLSFNGTITYERFHLDYVLIWYDMKLYYTTVQRYLMLFSLVNIKLYLTCNISKMIHVFKFTTWATHYIRLLDCLHFQFF